ncbi:MAG: sulfatase-like hydrolase/transferase [Armatimonadota bacterium]|nr:sulfatase-like hydrolase/transferase [Armatimonadota bacterium]
MARASRPNILFIISDQHNPRVVGYAGNEKAHTPNIDRLAERGVRFDACYCQSPLCVPSRLSLLTGKYAFRCFAWNNASVLYPDALTLPQHLGNHGYETVLVGKMHLKGPRWDGGFKHRPYGDIIIDRFCGHQPDPVETWDGRWCDHKVGRFPWAGETEIPESLLLDSVVTRESIAFLLEHADKNPEVPWFLCAGYGRPHFPFTAPGRYFRRAMADPPQLPPRPEGYPESLHPHDRYIVDDFHIYDFSDEIQQKTLAAYYACVNYLDDCIGELLSALERSGLLENTYVIYTSDHGEMAGEHGMWSKRSYYDGSSRVPLVICGPGIPAGRVVTTPVELLDLFPTFCDWAGIPSPEGLDGESLTPLLSGDAESRKKRWARSEILIPNERIEFRMARDERWKYVEFPAAPPVLFDMLNDPDETTNLLAHTDTQGAAAHDAPLDMLRSIASQGVSWEEVAAVREEETRRRPHFDWGGPHGPVQYVLRDGRIVDADIFLYPGLSESSRAAGS